MAPPAARAPSGAHGVRPSPPAGAAGNSAASVRAALLAADKLLLRADNSPLQDAVGLPCGNICDRMEVAIKQRFRDGFARRAERNPARCDELLESARQTYRCDCCRQDIGHPADELVSQPINGYLEQVRDAFPRGIAEATDAEVLAFAQRLQRTGQAIPTQRPTASVDASFAAPSMPAALLCPLTGKPFMDPVLGEDGTVYERAVYATYFDPSAAVDCSLMRKVMAAYSGAQGASQEDLDIALARSLVSETDGAPLFFPGIESTDPTRTVDLARAVVDAAARRPTGGRVNRTLMSLGQTLHALPHVTEALALELGKHGWTGGVDPVRNPGAAWQHAVDVHANLQSGRTAMLEGRMQDAAQSFWTFLNAMTQHHGATFACMQALRAADPASTLARDYAANMCEGAFGMVPQGLFPTAYGFGALHPDKVLVVMNFHLRTLVDKLYHYEMSYLFRGTHEARDFGVKLARACVEYLRPMLRQHAPDVSQVPLMLIHLLEQPSEMGAAIELAVQWGCRRDAACGAAVTTLLNTMKLLTRTQQTAQQSYAEACLAELNRICDLPFATPSMRSMSREAASDWFRVQRKSGSGKGGKKNKCTIM